MTPEAKKALERIRDAARRVLKVAQEFDKRLWAVCPDNREPARAKNEVIMALRAALDEARTPRKAGPVRGISP